MSGLFPEAFAGNQPLDFGGVRMTWSKASSPCLNNASFSSFGDSNVSLKPRSVHSVHQHNFFSPQPPKPVSPSKSPQNFPYSALSAAPSSTTSSLLPELLSACARPKNAKRRHVISHRILESACDDLKALQGSSIILRTFRRRIRCQEFIDTKSKLESFD